ncbi:hypothetical protein ACFXKG_05400 [Streptomyces sp. NPDC059255]|uniref:hypothetical protein n=1 Tax=Streptomyces sp. NPDC059255 TaxID=3346793 RepID=UPI00367CCC85
MSRFSSQLLKPVWKNVYEIETVPFGLRLGDGEQRQPGPLLRGERPSVAVLEPVQGDLLAFLQSQVERLGDADRLVEVADLRLVVPEEGDPAVNLHALKPQLQDLRATAAGEHQGLPGVPHSVIVRVVAARQVLQVRRVGQGSGNGIGERTPGLRLGAVAGGHRDDELPREPNLLGPAGVQGPAQDRPSVVENEAAGVLGDLAGLAVGSEDDQRRQALADPLVVVGDEAPHVLLAEQAGVVSPVGGGDFQERAQLGAGPTVVVEGARAARALGGLQPVGDVVPEEVPQPPLRDGGEVKVAVPLREADAEVLGLDVAGLLRLPGSEVDDPQLGEGLVEDEPLARVQLHALVGQRADAAIADQIDQLLDPPGRPVGVGGPLSMGEQCPLELGPQQRRQPLEVDRAGPRDGMRAPAPAAERGLVLVEDRHGLADHLEAVEPLLRALGAAGAAVRLVTDLMHPAQAHRAAGQRLAGDDDAVAVTVERLGLRREPVLEDQSGPGGRGLLPAAVVGQTQPQLMVAGAAFGTDPADRGLAHAVVELRGLGVPQEGATGELGVLPAAAFPFHLVWVAQIAGVGAGVVAALDPAAPAEHRMVGRHLDQGLAEERLDVRAAEQGRQHFQAVAGLPAPGRVGDGVQRQKDVAHCISPHVAISAAPKAGSLTST